MEQQPLTLPESGSSATRLLTVNELCREIGVSRTTLWRLREEGLPYLRVGRQIRFNPDEIKAWIQNYTETDRDGIGEAERDRNEEPEGTSDTLDPCHWAPSVALDPKHRPQLPTKPSTTVRSSWWRCPQEAHLLDPKRERYRRLTRDEIALLQGFPSNWADSGVVGTADAIRGYGNAVPPPLAEAIGASLTGAIDQPVENALEICAGFGGMTLGLHRAFNFRHVHLIDNWSPAARVLESQFAKGGATVETADLNQIEWENYREPIDLLAGGPPCQPWSRGGRQLGSEDIRDLLGITPDLVELLQPKIFVFENVPGLLMGENREYGEWLVRRLRESVGGRYGVAVGILNAADYGVPQVRRRAFIIGIQHSSVRDVLNIFDKIRASSTHSDARKPLKPGSSAWKTIADALPSYADDGHYWRRWLVQNMESSMDDPEGATGSEATTNLSDSPHEGRRERRSVSLEWPSKTLRPFWDGSAWAVSHEQDSTRPSTLPPLLPDLSGHDYRSHPWYLTGDPIDSLNGLIRTHARRSDLVYIDVPRLYTDAHAFNARAPEHRLDTWLTLVQSLIRRVFSLLADSGVAVFECGHAEQPHLSVLLSEQIGIHNAVGTVAWQKNYSPRNMPNMTEFSPSHDYLLVWAKRTQALRPVSLRLPAKGYKNPDGDPRGPWKAEQKGANKPDCDYEVNLPPYRWEILDGELPPGVWQINPKSGVIWGRKGDIQEPGVWKFRVKVTDKAGNTATRRLEIRVNSQGEPPNLHPPTWLIAKHAGDGSVSNAPKSGGKLRITTQELPPAVVGQEYSACVEAQGGTPWQGTTRPGKTSHSGTSRYWEFPAKTLCNAAARDAVDFKKKDDAIPALKRFSDQNAIARLNQTTTWLGRSETGINYRDDVFGAGYAQDAKTELQALERDGLINQIVTTSKPLRLMQRLLALFTKSDSYVIDIGSPAAEMATAATAYTRRAVYVEFPESSSLRDSLLRPRMQAAAHGEHPMPKGIFTDADHSETASEEEPTRGYFIHGHLRTEANSADLSTFRIGSAFIEIDRPIGLGKIQYDQYEPGSTDFLAALANAEGLVYIHDPDTEIFATDLQDRIVAAYLPSDQFLDADVAERLRIQHDSLLLSPRTQFRIYYHRGDSSITGGLSANIEARRVPYELRVMAGIV